MYTMAKIWLTSPPSALDGIYRLYSVRFMLKSYSYKCCFVTDWKNSDWTKEILMWMIRYSSQPNSSELETR